MLLADRRLSSARIAVAIVLASLAAGCGDSSPTGSSGNPTVTIVDLLVGTGATPVINRTVTVDYTGWVFDGTKADGKGLLFDSTAGDQPYTYVFGIGQVIGGFDLGVQGMQVGGKRRVTIPPELAYGPQGNAPIPPNATILFEITLVAVG
jgi:FKBP-type peptidyl-prolyl cis-trans isomerase